MNGHTFTVGNIRYTQVAQYMTRALKAAAELERFERMSRERRLRVALDAYYAMCADTLLTQTIASQLDFHAAVAAARSGYASARHARARSVDSRARRVRDARIIAAYRLLIASDML